MLQVLVIIFVTAISWCAGQELTSPCPEMFTYDPERVVGDRWYGVIKLQSIRDLSLYGIWLKVTLDRPAIDLGVITENWDGEVNTVNNKEYLIRNTLIKLLPGETIPLRLFVQFNAVEPVPLLESFQLNYGKGDCPEKRAAATSQQPQILPSTTESNKADTDPKPNTNRYQGSQPCGVVATLPLPLITHGQVAGEAQWPWHVALYSPEGINLQYICGASLVSLKHVLTAAHCVTKQASNNPVRNDDVVVYLGKYHLRHFQEKRIQNMQVSMVTVHPEFHHSSFVNDIAILTLTGPVEYTDYVRPVCLWSEGSDINEIVDRVGTVVGWGKDHTGTFTETLTKASMPIVSSLKCIYSYPEFFGKFTNERTFCAGFRNGTSACNGDSGGGMVFPKYNPNPNQPVWHVRGIVSTSVALQSQKVCNPSHYVVFTDVAKYSDWIKQNLV